MKLQLSILFCFFWVHMLFSQNEKQLNGQVKVVDATANHVLVLNLNNGQETFTDSNGKFSIAIHLGDILVFHATHLDKMRKLIDEEAYNVPFIEIPMTSTIEQLEEVTIKNFSRINAYDLGITKTRIKTLTPAERGKYSNEPRAKEFAEKLEAIEKLERICDVVFFKNISIEEENIKSFLFFAVDHQWFVAITKENNLFLTRFHLMSFSQEYNRLHKSNK